MRLTPPQKVALNRLKKFVNIEWNNSSPRNMIKIRGGGVVHHLSICIKAHEIKMLNWTFFTELVFWHKGKKYVIDLLGIDPEGYIHVFEMETLFEKNLEKKESQFIDVDWINEVHVLEPRKVIQDAGLYKIIESNAE